MIKTSDFKALLKVFHSAVVEMCEKDTVGERKAVIQDWIELMGHFDRSMGNMIFTNDKDERLKIVKEFEEKLKDFDFEDVIS